MLVLVWIFQGLCMLVDEFYFHHKRGLGKWESWGHPVDTLLLLSCFLFAYLLPYQSKYELAFGVLCFFSTLIITKDEFIHAKQSSGPENFLHALLFILHPLSLMVLYIFWKNHELFFIQIQAGIIFLFLTYQIIYWNLIRRNRYEISN